MASSIFGVLYLILAVMNLFVDFSFVDRAEAGRARRRRRVVLRLHASCMSSMMVYLALLRIFGGRN